MTTVQRVLRGGLVVFLLAVAGCSGKSEGEAPARTEQGAAQSVTVAATEVAVRAVERTLDVVGSLLPQESVTVASEVEGVVGRVVVDRGDRVRKGDLLVAFRDVDFQLKLREAQATVEHVQSEYERKEAIFRERMLAPQEFDDVAARLKLAQVGVDLAKEQLAKTRIEAPFDGEISEKLVSQGQHVNKHDPLVSVVVNDPLKLEAMVPERFLGEVRSGQVVRVRVEAFPDTVFKGRVTRVSPVVDVKSRSFVIEAAVPNPQRTLRAGVFARASILTRVEQGALMIPEQALVGAAGVTKVFVIAEGKVSERLVRTGTQQEGWVEVFEGVKKGERVAISRLGDLSEGTRVSVTGQEGAAQQP